MNLKFIKNIIFFAILLLAQVLVFNHVRIFGCATPLIYVYFVLSTPYEQPRWVTLLWCFAFGLIVDVFSDMPGVAAASMTLIALLQPYLLFLFLPRNCPEGLIPTYSTLGTGKYVVYASVLTLVYCLAFFTLEAFNFYNIIQWAANVGGCAVLTLLLILVIENFRKQK
jgi:rod shape-determining protein MreD